MDSSAESQPTDEQIRAFEAEAKKGFADSLPIGPLTSLDGLVAELENGTEVLQVKAAALVKRYKTSRAVRKDGNCFYRALGFGLCELVSLGDLPLSKVLGTKEILSERGYDTELLSDFCDLFAEALKSSSPPEAFFSIEHQGDAVVCYLRILTAAILKRDAPMYEAFVLDAYPSLEAFIAAQVEPMGIEADQIHLVAMANAFRIRLKIAVLDAGPLSPETSIHYTDIVPWDWNESSTTTLPTITLLFRPGHYDLLYPL